MCTGNWAVPVFLSPSTRALSPGSSPKRGIGSSVRFPFRFSTKAYRYTTLSRSTCSSTEESWSKRRPRLGTIRRSPSNATHTFGCRIFAWDLSSISAWRMSVTESSVLSTPRFGPANRGTKWRGAGRSPASKQSRLANSQPVARSGRCCLRVMPSLRVPLQTRRSGRTRRCCTPLRDIQHEGPLREKGVCKGAESWYNPRHLKRNSPNGRPDQKSPESPCHQPQEGEAA